MPAFLFKLENEDGTPAEPAELRAAVPNWRAGDTIHLGKRSLRVVALRDEDADSPPVLIVEQMTLTGEELPKFGARDTRAPR